MRCLKARNGPFSQRRLARREWKGKRRETSREATARVEEGTVEFLRSFTVGRLIIREGRGRRAIIND